MDISTRISNALSNKPPNSRTPWWHEVCHAGVREICFENSSPWCWMTLKICNLPDVYKFAWCRAIINLLMPDPQDVLNLSWRKTGVWNQSPRLIRHVGLSGNRRAYWQMQHWFLYFHNLPDCSILDLIWWLSMGCPAALIISKTKLASIVIWQMWTTSVAFLE